MKARRIPRTCSISLGLSDTHATCYAHPGRFDPHVGLPFASQLTPRGVGQGEAKSSKMLAE